jgi:hypothetical protein
LIYQRLSRPVELDGTERYFKAHVAEAMVGVSLHVAMADSLFARPAPPKRGWKGPMWLSADAWRGADLLAPA